jgi:hypothetical protein
MKSQLSGRAEAEWLDVLSLKLRLAQEALGSTELTKERVIKRLESAEAALAAEIKRRRRS